MTVTLDEETHRAARIAAAERGVSLSALVRDLLGRIEPRVDARGEAVRKSLATVFAAGVHPAATFVVTPLPHAKALVGLDAIAVTAKPPAGQRLAYVRAEGVPGRAGGSHAVVAPSGPMVFISGQAEAGSLAEATRKTMQSLHDTLKHLGLDASHVVQVKSFLRPMTESEVVDQEIAKFYPAGAVPAITHVEWTYSAPIEIEMIAIGKRSAAPPADPVQFLAPPHLKHSPVFSRITVTEGKPLVFVSSLTGNPGMSAEEQVKSVFDQLQAVLKSAGSDLRHMAKATYYVSDDAPSNALNVIRPQLYDPARPPAASKSGVKSVGTPGVGLSIDMIAVKKP